MLAQQALDEHTQLRVGLLLGGVMAQLVAIFIKHWSARKPAIGG